MNHHLIIFENHLGRLKSGCLKADLFNEHSKELNESQGPKSKENVHRVYGTCGFSPDSGKLGLPLLRNFMSSSEPKKHSSAWVLTLEAFLIGAYAVQTMMDYASTTNDWLSSLTIIAGASLF